MRIRWALASVLFCQLASAQGVVAIYPGSLTTYPGGTQQYLIYNTTSGAGVTWSVNGVTGGNATYGTISATGLYKAPASVPSSNVVAVKAASTPSGVSGSATVKVVQPIPVVWSTYPSSLPTGSNQTISLNGANFQLNSIVQVNGVSWTAMYGSPTSMKATGNLPATGNFR